MIHRRHFRWRGPQPSGDGELVANARDSFPNLTPVSEVPAITTRNNWAATLPSTVPFIWERDRYGGDEEV